MSDVILVFLSVFVACGFICESLASSSLLVDSHILNKVCLSVCPPSLFVFDSHILNKVSLAVFCFVLRKMQPIWGCCGVLRMLLSWDQSSYNYLHETLTRLGHWRTHTQDGT